MPAEIPENVQIMLTYMTETIHRVTEEPVTPRRPAVMVDNSGVTLQLLLNVTILRPMVWFLELDR